MSNYELHAWNEFRAAGWVDDNNNFEDEMQKDICLHILGLLAVFENGGHSGSSAPYAINIFKKLAMFEPLAPLTGEDWEWVRHDYGDTPTYQNKRMGSVFKQADRFDGQAYWLDGRVFWEWYKDEDGNMSKIYFTSRESMTPIEFPWTKPEHPEYVFSPTEEFPNEQL
jgi:hypothetical protein